MVRLQSYTLLSLYLFSSTSAYISSGLPAHTHQKWLEQLTVDICQSTPGAMTPEMLASTSQIMSAWAENPYIHGKHSKNDKHKQNNNYLEIYDNPPKAKDSHGMECALAVEKLLKRIVDERIAGNEEAVPTTALYNAALQGWAMAASQKERGAAAERAEQILFHMQAMFEAGDENVQPNAQSFYSAILAWSWSKDKTSAIRVLDILNWMVELAKSGKNDLALPEIQCFTMVLHMIARKGDEVAGRDAEDIFRLMESIYTRDGTTVKHFNSVLDAWRNSGVPEASQRTEDILNYMDELVNAGFTQVRPNLFSHSSVIQTISKSGDKSRFRRVNHLLRRLEKEFQNGNGYILPNNVVHNIVLDMWAKSDHPNAAKNTKKILDRMTKLSQLPGLQKCTPDAYSYASVMNACADTKGSILKRLYCYQMAREAFEELRKNENSEVYANHVIYGTMMKACGTLLRKDEEFRYKETRNIFNKCIQDGQAGDMFISRLRQAACADLYHELMDGNKKHDLPKEWDRNVQEKKSISSSKQKRKWNGKTLKTLAP